MPIFFSVYELSDDIVDAPNINNLTNKLKELDISFAIIGKSFKLISFICSQHIKNVT